MADHRVSAPITISIGLWKTCWNIPVSHPRPRKAVTPLPWRWRNRSNLLPQQLLNPISTVGPSSSWCGCLSMIVIVSCYCIWDPYIFSLLSFSGSFSSPHKEAGTCCISSTLLQRCCITTPSSSAKYSHINPPPRPLVPQWLFDSPILPNKAHHWTNAFNWQLEPINTEASSHGYDTIQYICAYSWMKNTFSAGFVLWKLSVSQASACPEKALETCRCLQTDSPCFSRSAPGVLFTLKNYNFADKCRLI